jgi:hypothetical protein
MIVGNNFSPLALPCSSVFLRSRVHVQVFNKCERVVPVGYPCPLLS